MEDTARVIAEIETHIESTEPILKATVLAWLHSDELEVRGAAEYVLMERDACKRVHPYLSARDYVDFMMPYYERCLKENPDGEYAPSSFMAGAEIVGGFLLLFNLLPVLGLTILCPVIFNIVLFHATMAPSGLGLAIVVALLALFLVWGYWEHYRHLIRQPNAIE